SSWGGASVETHPVAANRPKTVRTKAKSRSRIRGPAYRSRFAEGRVSGSVRTRNGRGRPRHAKRRLTLPLPGWSPFRAGKAPGQARKIFEERTLSPDHQALLESQALRYARQPVRHAPPNRRHGAGGRRRSDHRQRDQGRQNRGHAGAHHFGGAEVAASLGAP